MPSILLWRSGAGRLAGPSLRSAGPRPGLWYQTTAGCGISPLTSARGRGAPGSPQWALEQVQGVAAVVDQAAAGKHPGIGVELVRPGGPGTQDVPDLGAARHQGVGDEAAVAAPGHRLGAQDGLPCALGR